MITSALYKKGESPPGAHHGGTLDLVFASCLLPAATGSKVTNAISPIFSLPYGILSLICAVVVTMALIKPFFLCSGLAAALIHLAKRGTCRGEPLIMAESHVITDPSY